MKSLSISFSKVKTDVLRLSEYIGLKAGAFDKLRAIDSDNDQLLYWFKDGLTLVGVLLDRVIGKMVDYDSSAGTAVISFRVTNDNFPFVEEAVERVIAYHIITRWLQLVAPNLLEMYVVNYRQAEQSLLQLCYFREMPK